jgi:hypothetical protein
MRSSSTEPRLPILDERLATRFATIALSHVTREYPNRLDQVLTGRADLKSPRALHSIFYGSFDWHSCVHSYWLLATLHRLFPESEQATRIDALFKDAFTKRKVAAECAYLKRKSEQLFERPYGWAWLLMLQAELSRHEIGEGQRGASVLRPLTAMFVKRFHNYLPKAAFPNRAGTHGNTAFALALALEYAETVNDKPLAQHVRKTARRWYERDADCQAWEPSGSDFLSPALIEAECMRRMLKPDIFRIWHTRFLPRFSARQPKTLFSPVRVSDRADGHIVHLEGLNLSRAWCWRNLAESLPPGDPLRGVAADAARRHFKASASYLSGHYMGEHWLASFALLALRPLPLRERAARRARKRAKGAPGEG